MTLYAGGPYTPAAILGDSNLKRLLDDAVGSVDYYPEYLDVSRFSTPGYEDIVRGFLRSKYEGRRFDLIIATTDAALGFLLRSRDTLFPGVPVVFGSSVDPGPIPNATGVLGRINFGPALESAMTVQPDTTHVVVVTGAAASDTFYEVLAREQLKIFQERVTFTYLAGLPMSDLVRRVAVLPAHTIVFVLTVPQDGAGQRFLVGEAFARLSAAANVPVYTWHDSGADYGMVGGRVVSTAALLKHVGNLAVRVLRGERPDAIPVTEIDWSTTVFDWRQLQRWGISESRLPAGSTILFRQPGAWEQYGRYIIGGVALLGTQTALIGALLFHRRRRQRIERALRESEERFRLMADTAPVLVWRSGTDKRCDYFNRPWLEFTGRALEQELGDGWSEGVWPGDLDGCLHTYASAFDARQPFRMEYRLRAADGTYRWLLDTGVPRFGPDGVFAGYIGSCLDITDRREMEDALRASDHEVRHLAGRLIEAQDNERARIARDLHDDVSQQLAGLSISLSSLKRRLGPSTSDGDPQSEVSSLQHRTIALAEDVRNLSHDLHPDVMRHVGLVAALGAHCAEIQRQHPVSITFDVQGDIDSVGRAIAVCLYRVAQETLRNVVTHANASRAEVRLRRTAEHVELAVGDNGKGFDVARTRETGSGLGLVSLTERVRLAGGTVTIVTEVNKGTRVRVRIPLPPLKPACNAPEQYDPSA